MRFEFLRDQNVKVFGSVNSNLDIIRLIKFSHTVPIVFNFLKTAVFYLIARKRKLV